MIGEARARGLDVTTECYPYIAGMTDIKSAIFNEGWQEVFGIDYKDLQWAATGERLTKETSTGVRFVTVNGVLILKDGQLQTNVYPGVAIRASF